MKNKFIYVLLVLTLIFGFSCSLQKNYNDVSILGVAGIHENIDSTFWVNTPPEATAFVDFSLAYEGELVEADIVQLVWYPKANPNYVWEMDFSSENNNFDAENKIIGKSYDWFYSETLKHVIPGGTIVFKMTLINGDIKTKEITLPVPGGTASPADIQWLYTEDYNGTIDSTYAALVKRASIVSGSKNSTTATIVFDTNDTKAYNGYVMFYSSDNKYIAVTDFFRDFDTGVLKGFINSGSAFNNDGSHNTISISTGGDITFADGKSFADVAYFHIVLTDGAHLASTKKTYYFDSISAKYTF